MKTLKQTRWDRAKSTAKSYTVGALAGVIGSAGLAFSNDQFRESIENRSIFMSLEELTAPLREKDAKTNQAPYQAPENTVETYAPEPINQKPKTNYPVQNLKPKPTKQELESKDPIVKIAHMPLSDLERQILIGEGCSDSLYFDSKGKRTIGIGFNLERNGARERIEKVGANYDLVFEGKESISENQIYSLLKMDLRDFEVEARKIFPSFYSQPETVKNILVDMTYNMGGGNLRGFTNLREAIKRKDYTWAADEMVDSKWYREDVGTRGKELVAKMRSVK